MNNNERRPSVFDLEFPVDTRPADQKDGQRRQEEGLVDEIQGVIHDYPHPKSILVTPDEIRKRILFEWKSHPTSRKKDRKRKPEPHR